MNDDSLLINQVVTVIFNESTNLGVVLMSGLFQLSVRILLSRTMKYAPHQWQFPLTDGHVKETVE